MVGFQFSVPVADRSTAIDASANGEYCVKAENGAAIADAELVTRLVHAEEAHDGEECSDGSRLQIAMRGPALVNGTGCEPCGKLQTRSKLVGFDAAGHVPEISVPAKDEGGGKASVDDVGVKVAELVYAG